MKPNRLTLLITILLLGFLSIQAKPVKTHGKLSVKGTFLVDENGEQTMLSWKFKKNMG